MKTGELVKDIKDRHVVIYGSDDDQPNGLFYAEYEPRYGVTFTTDTPDYAGPSTDRLLEALYDHDVYTVIIDVHQHVGEHHSKDYTAEFTDATDTETALSFILGLYDNDDWAWQYHTEPLP